jgi:hypothetical protein
MPICITLAAESGARALREASASGLPPELWARLAIEAARQLRRTSLLAGLDRDALTARLDELANDDEATAVALGTRSLSGYAQLLRAAEPSNLRRSRPGGMTLLVPDALALSWTRTANACRLTLSMWASECVLGAPVGVVRWEAAAATNGDSLGEWILAAALVGPS